MIEDKAVIRVSNFEVVSIDEPRAILFDLERLEDIQPLVEAGFTRVDIFNGGEFGLPGKVFNTFELNLAELNLNSISFISNGSQVTITVTGENVQKAVTVESKFFEVWVSTRDEEGTVYTLTQIKPDTLFVISQPVEDLTPSGGEFCRVVVSSSD